MIMSTVKFSSVSKYFGSVCALSQTDLEIRNGEFLTLLGPSGSGKTTLLNICAGYTQPTSGKVLIGDRDITDLPPRLRNMGMVFQSYALFPHLTVKENVSYGLQARKLKPSEISQRVIEILRMMQLEGYENRQIRELSGGQQQRVALARAMVIKPEILLMDEPLGALDRQLRKEVQLEIRRLHLNHPRTTIYVTHDQEEALVMSDRIVVMRQGKIIQSGTGSDLYERPDNTFVARFLGESNLLEGVVSEVTGTVALLDVPGLSKKITGRAAKGLKIGARASALLRPETIQYQSGGIAAVVLETVYLGELIATKLKLSSGHEVWSRRLAGEFNHREGIEVGWDETRVSILPDVSH